MDAPHITTAVVILSVLAAARCFSRDFCNRKCSDLCAKLPACISFKFESLSRECKLETTTQQGGIDAAFEMSSALSPSSKNFFQFLTIRHMVKYGQDKEEPDIQTKENRQNKEEPDIQTKENLQDGRRHLLIVPEKRKRKIILLNLHKLTKERTKMKIVPGIVAMAYMASINRLIISKYFHSSVIISFDLRERFSKMIVKGFAPKAIAVDGERKLLFFIHGEMAKPGHFKVHLYKLTIGFRHPLVIKTLEKTPGQDILANPSKQTLFLCYNKFILEISYNGDTIRKITASFATRGMCLHVEMQTLYYISRTVVKGVKLGSIYKTENIIDLHVSLKGLVCNNNTLYVMALSNRVFAVNLNTRVVVASVGLKLKQNIQFPMCTVP